MSAAVAEVSSQRRSRYILNLRNCTDSSKVCGEVWLLERDVEQRESFAAAQSQRSERLCSVTQQTGVLAPELSKELLQRSSVQRRVSAQRT